MTRPPRDLYEQVKGISADRAAELLGLTRARERGKYACPVHGGSDSLHAYRGEGRGFYCWGACQRAYSAIDLGCAVWGVEHGEACQRLADAMGFTANNPLVYRPPPATKRERPAEPTIAEHPALVRLREDGMVPELPPMVYGAVLDALTQTPDGATALRGRGFDPKDAAAYGFRSVDGAREWAALGDALAGEFCPDVLEAARLYQRYDGQESARWAPPWYGRAPTLVIPFLERGACVGLRFRRLDAVDDDRYHTLRGGMPRVPFHADALATCARQTLHVVEGELNAYAMGLAGYRAIGLPGAGIWRQEWTEALDDVAQLVLWFDDDPSKQVGGKDVLGAGPGAAARRRRELVERYGRTWVEERLRTVFLPRDETGVPLDPNDLFQRGALDAYVVAALR